MNNHKDGVIRLGLLIAVCGLTGLVAGCTGGIEGPQRVVVSGVVTWNGAPLPKGMMTLTPTEDTDAPPSGAEIIEGKYHVDNKGGVVPGTYQVKVTAERPKPGVKITDPDFPPTEQYIPAKYNKETTLTMTVPADSSDYQQDFRLEE